MMKKISNFKNKKVLVLGLAKSGESAARVLKALGAIVTVNDGKPFDENPAAQSLLAEGIKVITGEHPIGLLEEAFEVTEIVSVQVVGRFHSLCSFCVSANRTYVYNA